MDPSDVIVLLIIGGVFLYAIGHAIVAACKPQPERVRAGPKQKEKHVREPIEKDVTVTQENVVHSDNAVVVEHKRAPALDAIVKGLSSKKMLWIAHEIVAPPLSLRPPSRQAGYLEDQR